MSPDLAAATSTLIVNNRPDDEETGQPAGAEIEAAARAAGLDYVHIPIGDGFSDAKIAAMVGALANARGTVLLYCKSGTRSAFLWALARARQGADAEELVSLAAPAGYDRGRSCLGSTAPTNWALGEYAAGEIKIVLVDHQTHRDHAVEAAPVHLGIEQDRHRLRPTSTPASDQARLARRCNIWRARPAPLPGHHVAGRRLDRSRLRPSIALRCGNGRNAGSRHGGGGHI